MTLSFDCYVSPAKFERPEEVTEIGLDDSHLEVVPGSLATLFPNLEVLTVRRNRLTRWPDFLPSMKRLREIDLGDNDLEVNEEEIHVSIKRTRPLVHVFLDQSLKDDTNLLLEHRRFWELREELSEVQQRLREKTEALKVMTEEILRAKEDNEKRLQLLETRVDSNSVALEQATEMANALPKIRKELEEKTRLLGERDKVIAQKDKLLQKKEKQMEAHIQQREKKLHDQTQEIEDFRAQAQQASARAEAAARELLEVKKVAQAGAGEKEGYEKRLAKLQGQVSGRDGELQAAKRQVTEAQERIAQLQEEVAEREREEKEEKRRKVKREEPFVVVSMAEMAQLAGGLRPEAQVGPHSGGTLFAGASRGTEVMVLQLPKLGKEKTQLQLLQDDLHLMARVRHPHLMEVMAHTDLTSKAPTLVFSHSFRGTLRDFLDRRGGRAALAWETRVRIGFQVAAALCALHQPLGGGSTLAPICHGHLGSDTVFLTPYLEAQVFGAGLQLLRPASLQGRDVCPLVLSGTAPALTPEADVYALGVLLAELVTGKPSIHRGLGGVSVTLSALLRGVIQDTSPMVDPFILDPAIRDTWPPQLCLAFTQVSRKCVEVEEPRPTSLEVVENLAEILS